MSNPELCTQPNQDEDTARHTAVLGLLGDVGPKQRSRRGSRNRRRSIPEGGRDCGQLWDLCTDAEVTGPAEGSGVLMRGGVPPSKEAGRPCMPAPRSWSGMGT